MSVENLVALLREARPRVKYSPENDEGDTLLARIDAALEEAESYGWAKIGLSYLRPYDNYWVEVQSSETHSFFIWSLLPRYPKLPLIEGSANTLNEAKAAALKALEGIQ